MIEKKRANIYKITNTITKKAYIGITTYKKPINRWRKHILISKNKTLYLTNGVFRALHQDILDLGVQAFTFEILEETTIKSGFKREQYWIKLHNTFGEHGYNRTAGGRGFNGRSHSQETKDLLSAMNKGKIDGNKNPMFGRHHSEEAKAKISAGNTKKKFNRGKNNPFYGRKHSPETIALLKEKAEERGYKKEWTEKRLKLQKEDIIEIKKLYQSGVKVKELAEKYDVSVPCIYKVLKKDRQIDQE